MIPYLLADNPEMDRHRAIPPQQDDGRALSSSTWNCPLSAVNLLPEYCFAVSAASFVNPYYEMTFVGNFYWRLVIR